MAAGGPESTNVPQSTTTASATGNTSGSPASTSVSTSPGSSSSSHSSNAGAIAGGVVGGVVGLALVAALAFWWTRRRTQPAQSTLVDPMTTSPASPAAASFNQTAPLIGAASPKLYVRSLISSLSTLILIDTEPFRSEYIPLLASNFWHLYYARISAVFTIHPLKSKPVTGNFIP